MKALGQFAVAALLATFVGVMPLSAQGPAGQSSVVRQALEKIVAQEKQLVEIFSHYSPRVETYLQGIHTDKNGKKEIIGDDYFLGRLEVKNGVVERSFLHSKGISLRGFLGKLPLYGSILPSLSFELQSGSFAEPIFIDPQHFDLQHYQFEFVGRQFLGEVRCLVFDVRPRAHAGKGLFEGRVWVEDQGFHIVRFNGAYGRENKFSFHFDSWRENLQPGLWLPVYVYSEESSLAKYGVSHLGFRSQTRLWGYVLKAETPEGQLTRILIESRTPVKDSNSTSQDNSPLASERQWRHEAEVNALSRLQKAGLLAPPGPVDKVLETVVNNLVVTNHLDNLPPIHCRVMLTYPLESFTVGGTIVLSKGLIDVLPNEASLAMILAHELAHIVSGDTTDTKYAFFDRMMVSDDQLLKTFDFAHKKQGEEAVDQEAIKLLENSPYKEKLGEAGLFLEALAGMAPRTPDLFASHLGHRLIDMHHQLQMAQLLQGAPKLEPNSIKQIAALPLGARIKVNAWNDKVSLMKTKPVNLISAKDKMPFEVTPLFPYLTRYDSKPGR